MQPGINPSGKRAPGARVWIPGPCAALTSRGAAGSQGLRSADMAVRFGRWRRVDPFRGIKEFLGDLAPKYTCSLPKTRGVSGALCVHESECDDAVGVSAEGCGHRPGGTAVSRRDLPLNPLSSARSLPLSIPLGFSNAWIPWPGKVNRRVTVKRNVWETGNQCEI